jgi:hypothetical protein
MKNVCDGLPKDIPHLRAECLYDWAIRFRDSAYCQKFTKEDIDGVARCWNKMAEELKDQHLCQKIPSDHYYRGICDRLKP